MSRNGFKGDLLGIVDPVLKGDAMALAGPDLQVAPSKFLGLGILAAFARSRKLRQRIKFAAQVQAHRLG